MHLQSTDIDNERNTCRRHTGDTSPLVALIAANEDWLIQRILAYAKMRRYTKYTSTLEEAWRLSISGLSASLLDVLRNTDSDLELDPDEDYTGDPATRFGVIEARRHRQRGISFSMFLGLMKYYRQSYGDLVRQSDFNDHLKKCSLQIITRYFDRVEIGFCTQWAALTESAKTAELRAANRLITNEKNRYLTLFESLPTPVLLVGKDMRIDNMNQAAMSSIQSTNAQCTPYYVLPAEPDSRLRQPNHREPVGHLFPWLADDLTNFMASQDTHRFIEKALTDPDNHCYYAIRMSRMRDVSGKFEGTVIIMEDVTERKRILNRLHHQNAQLEALHETALDIINRLELDDLLESAVNRAADLARIPNGYLYLFDPRTNLLTIKAGCGGLQKAVGHSRKPGQGLSGKVFESGTIMVLDDYQTWPERDASPVFADIHAIAAIPLQTKSKVSGVLGMAHHDTTPIRGENIDNLVQFAELVAVAIDNARLYNRLEDELETRQRLEKERQKIETLLIQSQKMEAIGTLAGGVAHDFNNLLMGIQGNVSLLHSRISAGDADYERLDHITTYIRKASKLTRQLLGLARGGNVQKKALNLNDLIIESAQMFGRTQKEIDLHLDLANDLPAVEVNADQIDQVLLNLFVNAQQAMPDGGRLSIHSQKITLDKPHAGSFGAAAGDFIKVTVQDTGTGMSKRVKQRVFDPFFSTKANGRGTGLGLATTFAIIKNHGGNIEVASEPGRGSAFTLYLPASPLAAEGPRQRSRGSLGGTETLLLVDDEEMIREVGREMLCELGYSVLTAGEGAKALTLYAEAQKIDLVIIDMIMPNMRGDELYARLKKINPQVKTLLCSGYSLEQGAQKILAQGCNGFIQKPFTMEQFSRKIRSILDCGCKEG